MRSALLRAAVRADYLTRTENKANTDGGRGAWLKIDWKKVINTTDIHLGRVQNRAGDR